jgi:hypothetical protein
MSKARDLANIISGGAILADGAIAVSEVTGLHAVASSGAASDVTGLATVATSGAYSDVTGTPTLGTASALDVGTSANNIPQLDSNGKLGAIDGSNLTGVSAGVSSAKAHYLATA